MLPMDIATYLTPEEVASVRDKLGSGLKLRPVYLRCYPNGTMAAHIIGYSGKTASQAHGPIQPNELLWPDLEGREGLEKTFNEQLTGKPGLLNITFDGKGNKTSERIVTPPIPGNNVVTTLDLHLQQLCEQNLAKQGKRGAIVMMDPNNGDVLALASWPTFDPNKFVPQISEADFKKINEDPNIPLIPRAYRASYPAGSTFKVIVGAAALQTQTISKDDEFSGPTSMYIGNILFHNWKKTDAGDLNFVQALAQSCDTWFYQVGIKTGSAKIIDFAQRFGFGQRTGLPLRDETVGLVPNDEYMKQAPQPPPHGRRRGQPFHRPGRPGSHADPDGAGDGGGGQRRQPVPDPAGPAGPDARQHHRGGLQRAHPQGRGAVARRGRHAQERHGNGRRPRHGRAGARAQRRGRRQDRHRAVGRGQRGQEQVAHGLVVRGFRPGGQAAVRLRRAGRGRRRRQAAQQRDGGAAHRQGCCARFTRTRSPSRTRRSTTTRRTTADSNDTSPPRPTTTTQLDNAD